MKILLTVLLGPELYWLALYMGFRWLASRNDPPSESGNATLQAAVYVAASAGVALAFGFLAVPGAHKGILFARLAVTAAVGVIACAVVACEGIRYPEAGRDSGLLGVLMYATMLGGLVWIVGAIASWFLFVRASHP